MTTRDHIQVVSARAIKHVGELGEIASGAKTEVNYKYIHLK